MTNDKKLMLLAAFWLWGCWPDAALPALPVPQAAWPVLPAAVKPKQVSSEVRDPARREGVVMPIDQGSLEEMKTGSYKFAANITSVAEGQMTLRSTATTLPPEDIDALRRAAFSDPSGRHRGTQRDSGEHRKGCRQRLCDHQWRHRRGRRGPLAQTSDIYRTVTFDDYPVYYDDGRADPALDDSVTLSDSSARPGRCRRWRRTAPMRWARPSRRQGQGWMPYNTTVFTKDGDISSIVRIWVP